MRTLSRSERLKRDIRHLETSTARIASYQEQLMAGISTLKPIEYDRLLDAYHAELIRSDRLEQEIQSMTIPETSLSFKERRCKLNRERREKINY